MVIALIALGIDAAGRKYVLGLREGATETAAVTTGLLSDLVTRGLPTDRTLLFVIDGAPGLRCLTAVNRRRAGRDRLQSLRREHQAPELFVVPVNLLSGRVVGGLVGPVAMVQRWALAAIQAYWGWPLRARTVFHEAGIGDTLSRTGAPHAVAVASPSKL